MTGVTVLSNTPGISATIVIEIIGQSSNLGFHTVSVTAVDNGSPPAATNNNFVIEILPTPFHSIFESTYRSSNPRFAVVGQGLLQP